MLSLRTLKYEFIRTPLERPLRRLRHALGVLERRRHPELREIHAEDARIEAVLSRLLKPDSCCIDIGCHYGSMLSGFCRRAPAGRHVAFEAIPEKLAFLRRKFPEVDVLGLALSERSGMATFYIDREATGFSTLSPSDGRQYSAIEVPCARLDDVLPGPRHYTLLKLDVEGAELLVLRGAAATLGRDRPYVLFECGPGGAKSFGYQPGELHDWLTQQSGYAVFFLKDFLEDRPTPASREAFVAAITVYPFQAFNWLAVPKERVGRS